MDACLNYPFDQYQRYRQIYDIIESFREGSQKFDILEVGSGNSNILRQMLPNDDINYLDRLDIGNIEIANDYSRTDFLDFTSPKKYDFVISIDVLEHIIPSQRACFINKHIEYSILASIISAPYSKKLTTTYEKLLNQYWKIHFGDDHPWLIEHIMNGLPNIDEITHDLNDRGLKFDLIPNGYVHRWYENMMIEFLGDITPDISSSLTLFHQIYNSNFYNCDNIEPSYRNSLVIYCIKRNNDRHFSYSTNPLDTDLQILYLKLKELINISVLEVLENENKGFHIKELEYLSKMNLEGTCLNITGTMKKTIDYLKKDT